MARPGEWTSRNSVCAGRCLNGKYTNSNGFPMANETLLAFATPTISTHGPEAAVAEALPDQILTRASTGRRAPR